MKKLLACLLFCGLTFVNSSIAFAVGTNDFKDQPKSQVVAVVRMEGDQAKCVKYSDDRMAAYLNLELPVCLNEGAEAEQNQMALSFAQADGKTRTAFLSYLGVALGGCIFGAGMELGQELINPYPSIPQATFTTLFSTITGYYGGLAYSAAVVGADPSGHMLAGAGGAVVCGSTVMVSFIIYRSIVKSR